MTRHYHLAVLLALFAAVLVLLTVSGFLHIERSSSVLFAGLYMLPSLAVAALGFFCLRRAVRDLAPRAATPAVLVAVLAYSAILFHGILADAPGFALILTTFSVLSAMAWSICIVLLGTAARLSRDKRPLALLLRVPALFFAAAPVVGLLWWWYVCAPFHASHRVETVGDPPRTVVLSDAWIGWNPGICDLRLYVRSAPDAPWDAWLASPWPHFLANTAVEFTPDGTPRVFLRRGSDYEPDICRPADLPPDSKGPIWPAPPGTMTYPADLTPADLHSLHQSLCRP